MGNRTILITAADEKFFDLARGCIESIRDKPPGRQIDLAFLDLGCTNEQLHWIGAKATVVSKPEWDYSFPGQEQQPGYFRGLLARPFLRRYFPDYDIYVWIDADAWVQDWHAIDLFIEGAANRRGLAIVPELDRGHYVQFGGLPGWWKKIHRWYADSFGPKVAQQLSSFPILNAGVFALHKDAPHWTEWENVLRESLQKTCTLFTDQVALNYVVYRRGLFPRTELLPAWCNWTCHLGMPRWDESRQCLVEPYLPNTAIGIMHLSAKKHEKTRLSTCKGGEVEIRVRYPSTPVDSSGNWDATTSQFEGDTVQATQRRQVEISSMNTLCQDKTDYVSPGLERISLHTYFPHMVVGDTALCSWVHLRRYIGHNWYVDHRAPSVGFLNPDEVHILYNTALRFKGRRGLEIGSWLGWSTCHLAAAGVHLDVVDPINAQAEVRETVMESLQAANVMSNVNLVAGSSPQKVDELASHHNRRWSFFFIDGNHEAPHPLDDAKACVRHAEDDALILFHDLAAPDVGAALDYLQQSGWQTCVYQTMQVMGAAWRGRVQPVTHVPDPNIDWPLLQHLERHVVVGKQIYATPSCDENTMPVRQDSEHIDE